MKRSSKLGSRIAVAAVSVVMALTMMSISQGGVVFAGEEDNAAITVGSGILAKGANTASAPTVRYGSDKSWRVVDYNASGSDVLGRSGSVTLLLDGVANLTKFNEENNNQYSASNLKNYLESWLQDGTGAAFTSAEKAASFI